jgi:hypothetical protein
VACRQYAADVAVGREQLSAALDHAHVATIRAAERDAVQRRLTTLQQEMHRLNQTSVDEVSDLEGRLHAALIAIERTTCMYQEQLAAKERRLTVCLFLTACLTVPCRWVIASLVW